jgi:RNA polymerase sigma factor (sigma-70 family)
MSTQRLQSLLRSLRHAAGAGGNLPSDGELLSRWLLGREELAFEVLVWRHGPLVLGVCRRALSREADIEDAFQATFLTLVRKAGSIRDGGSLAAWLHRVAWRVALRARRSSSRRDLRECPLTEEVAGPVTDIGLGELLDSEIDRLPERYRRTVVLCLLEGHSPAEAALLLGMPTGTVSSLLSRARERLRGRLARHGLDPQPTPPAVPAALVAPTVRLACSPPEALGAALSRIVELSSGVITEMSRQKLMTGFTVVLSIAVLFGGGSIPLFYSFTPRTEAADKSEEEPEPTLVEPFNGKLRLNWKVVRPDEDHWSLKKNKGKLTITTQRGTIHSTADRTEIKAKNLFLLNNPYPRAADFEVIVCVSSFTPTQLYQQCGLLCYDDDDNYIKFVCQFDSNKGQGSELVVLREIGASSKRARADSGRREESLAAADSSER